MKPSNPFTLTFGKKPTLYLSRQEALQRIIDAFEEDPPSQQTYLIAGVRGVGKTVLLTDLYRYFEAKEDWIVIDLVPSRDMVESFASKLYTKSHTKRFFLKGEVSLSFHGLGFSIEEAGPEANAETLLEKMLGILTKKKKKVLITVDEVSSTQEVKEFIHVFQSLLRLDAPIYLAMTGLHENLDFLKNEDAFTFLFRAPTLTLGPLSLSSIRDCYKTILNCTEEDSIELAKATNGYPFAFQLLGHILFEKGKKKIDPDVLSEYDHGLETFVYAKIWKGLSQKDRILVTAITSREGEPTSVIENAASMTHPEFCVYRKRLIDKGVAYSETRGQLTLLLPRFGVFLANLQKFE